VEGDEGKDGVAMFGMLFFIDAPELLDIEFCRKPLALNVIQWMIAVVSNDSRVIKPEAANRKCDSVTPNTRPKSLV